MVFPGVYVQIFPPAVGGTSQEEIFVRFRLVNDGEVLSRFTFEKKDFVTPLMSTGNYQGSGVEAYESNSDNNPAHEERR